MYANMYQNRIPLLENICKKYSLDEKLFITLQMAIQNSMASKKQQNKNQIEVVGKSNSQELVAKCDQFNVLSVEQTIFTFRGIQVIIDRDLAQLYGVETKQLNQQVRRNIERFPLSFRFQLTKEEKDELVTNCDRFNSLKHSTVNPYAFTEQGVAMLSAVLKSDTAIKVSIQIMQAFVAMRRYISANAGIFQRVESLERRQIETEDKVDRILDKIEEKSPSPTADQLFQTGCIWDAWSYVSDLVRSATKQIILIDNFVDDRVLTLLTKRREGVKAIIHTRYNEQLQLDLEKHNEQYAPIEVVQLPHKNHDRFLIIDDQVYLLGASVKDMGSSLCAITKVSFTVDMVLGLLK